MQRCDLLAPLLGGFLALSAGAPLAAPVLYQGADAVASFGDATPNSTAAAALFDAAVVGLGTSHLVDFEFAPFGTFAALAVAPGVTVSGLGYAGMATHAVAAGLGRAGCGNLCGFNTTAGASRYLDVDAGSITFTFASGISAFGAYFTGVQFTGETIRFDDGSSRVLELPSFGSGAQFFGFADAGASITSIVLETRNFSNLDGDFVGIDDFRYVTAPLAVPEPATLALVGLALAGMTAARRRRR